MTTTPTYKTTEESMRYDLEDFTEKERYLRRRHQVDTLRWKIEEELEVEDAIFYNTGEKPELHHMFSIAKDLVEILARLRGGEAEDLLTEKELKGEPVKLRGALAGAMRMAVASDAGGEDLTGEPIKAAA